MGREARAHEAMVAAMKEAAGIHQGAIYDRYGRELQVGNLVHFDQSYEGDWILLEARPALEPDMPRGAVHVLFMVERRLTLQGGMPTPGILQAMPSKLRDDQIELLKKAQEGAGGEAPPAGAGEGEGTVETPTVDEFTSRLERAKRGEL